MKTTLLLVVAATVASALATSVLAACSETPIVHEWNTQAGDVRVSGDFVRDTVLGKKVRFEDAYEHYRNNGSYRFRDGGGNTHNPNGYVFYADGTRCLNYDRPRYDLYVVRDQQLVLINMQGGRFTAKLTR